MDIAISSLAEHLFEVKGGFWGLAEKIGMVWQSAGEGGGLGAGGVEDGGEGCAADGGGLNGVGAGGEAAAELGGIVGDLATDAGA